MPTNVSLSKEQKDEILQGQGLCMDTKKRRNMAFDHFCSFIKDDLAISGHFSLEKAVMEDNTLAREDVYKYYKE